MQCFFAHSQTISGKIHDVSGVPITLAEVYGGRVIAVDSTVLTDDNLFSFDSPIPYEHGFYQLWLPEMAPIDIIVSDEPVFIEIFTDGTLNIRTSTETRLFHELVQLEQMIEKRIEALTAVRTLYLADQRKTYFLQLLEREIGSLQSEMSEYTGNIIAKYPDSFLAAILKANRTPPADDYSNEIKSASGYQNSVHEHYFDNVDFSDRRLLRSNLLPAKINGYLALFENQTENRLMSAIDLLLDKTGVDDKMVEFTLNYLLGTFERSEFDETFLHLSEVYTSRFGCQNDFLQTDMEQAMEIRRNLMPGRFAPPLTINDVNDNPVSLYDIEAEYTLIFFWASWCPHCNDILPQVQQLYRSFGAKGLEILAVSVDRTKEEWIAEIEERDLRWINVSELREWGSESVNIYNVQATPTFYLLGKNKEIIGKYTSPTPLFSRLTSLMPN